MFFFKTYEKYSILVMSSSLYWAKKGMDCMTGEEDNFNKVFRSFTNLCKYDLNRDIVCSWDSNSFAVVATDKQQFMNQLWQAFKQNDVLIWIGSTKNDKSIPSMNAIRYRKSFSLKISIIDATVPTSVKNSMNI